MSFSSCSAQPVRQDSQGERSRLESQRQGGRSDAFDITHTQMKHNRADEKDNVRRLGHYAGSEDTQGRFPPRGSAIEKGSPRELACETSLVKTGGRLVKHARYYWLLLAESHLTRRLFASMVRRIELLPLPAG